MEELKQPKKHYKLQTPIEDDKSSTEEVNSPQDSLNRLNSKKVTQKSELNVGNVSSEFIHTIGEIDVNDVIIRQNEDFAADNRGSGQNKASTKVFTDVDFAKFKDSGSFSDSGSIYSKTTTATQSEEVTELEIWWLQSPIWRRSLPFMCICIFIIGCAHLGAAAYLFISGEDRIKNPYVCRTDSCREQQLWLTQAMNPNANPCIDFYEFVCGNYHPISSHHNNSLKLNKVEMNEAKLELDEESTIASVLKNTEKSVNNFQDLQQGEKDKIIARLEREFKIVIYYKSCLNERRRRVHDYSTMIDAINEILATPFRGDFVNFGLSAVSGNVSLITGEFGAFRIKLLRFPQAALLPPFTPGILKDIDINNASHPKTKRFIDSLTICYTKLFNKSHPSHFQITEWHPLNPSQTVNDTITYLKFLNNFVLTKPRTREALRGETTDRGSATSFSPLFRAHELTETFLFGKTPEAVKTEWVDQSVDGFVFTVVDLFKQIRETTSDKYFGRKPGFLILPNSTMIPLNDTRIRQGLTSLWIYKLLQTFSTEVTSNVYDELKFGDIFPGSTRSEDVPLVDLHLTHAIFNFFGQLERFCFDSLLSRLNALTILQLEGFNEDSVNKSQEYVSELVKRVQRVLRRFIPQLENKYLHPDQFEVTKKLFGVDSTIEVHSPVHSNLKYLEQISHYYDNFHPSDNYLDNVWKARQKFFTGSLNAWRNRTFDPDKEVIYELEELFESNNNEMIYKNIIRLPLVMFGPPFITNEISLLDSSGGALYIARSLIDLWLINRRVPDVFYPDSDQLNATFHSIPKYAPESQDAKVCLGPGKPPPDDGTDVEDIYSFIRTTLAFNVALELEKHPNLYSSRRFKKSGKLASHIEIKYDENGSGTHNLVDISNSTGDPTNGRILSVDESSQFEPYDKKSHRLKFTKLPGPVLEKFTEKQLFFVTAVRHLCQHVQNNISEEVEKINIYKEDLHKSLSHLKEFSEAWNCPIGSKLNSPTKCFGGSLFVEGT